MKQLKQIALAAPLLLALSAAACGGEVNLLRVTVGEAPTATSFELDGINVVSTKGEQKGVTAVTDMPTGTLTVSAPDCETVLKVSGSTLVVTDKGDCPLTTVIETTTVNTAVSAGRSVSMNTYYSINYIKLFSL